MRARLLNNLGNMLSELGRREDALQAAQEALDIYRKLSPPADARDRVPTRPGDEPEQPGQQAQRTRPTRGRPPGRAGGRPDPKAIG